MSHGNKDVNKMTRLFAFYLVQLWIYGYVFKLYVWEKTFLHEIIVFEVGSMVFYLLLNGVKYATNYIEFVTLGDFSTFKSRLFVMSDLGIHLVKICFQIACLVRFTIYYNYPVFWARDIFLSIMISFEYIKKYLASLRMIRDIDRLPSVAVTDKDENCGICLHQVTMGTMLPCRHYFHRECLVYFRSDIETGYISLPIRTAVQFAGRR